MFKFMSVHQAAGGPKLSPQVKKPEVCEAGFGLFTSGSYIVYNTHVHPLTFNAKFHQNRFGGLGGVRLHTYPKTVFIL